MREIQDLIEKTAPKFPVIALMGPRQSGKTTLARTLFPKHKYISLEDFDVRELAKQDPRKFLSNNRNERGIILDEVQHTPELLSYIQTFVDEYKVRGYFILTGSSNFMLNETITQSLAGRMAIFTLLPLSISELKNASLLPKSPDALMLKGSYPAIYAEDIEPSIWYKGYIMSYIERDVRQIATIKDLALFQKFMKLCAGRVGQLLNVASLSDDCGVNQRTVKEWLSVLEASYIIHLLQPHHVNFNKRLTKSPKLFFYDIGLLCSLLGLESAEQLSNHYARGNIFESLVIAELLKKIDNNGRLARLYFWRSHHGDEVDCIIETGAGLIPVEVKSGMTISSDYFKGLQYWYELSGVNSESGYVVYAGDQTQNRSLGHVINWRDIDTINF
jgi:predicted AAA+ superfamily ATPase